MTAVNRSNAPPAVACDHCGLPVPKGLIEEGAGQQFCCNGCRTVYETIHACRLDRYYKLRDSIGASGVRSESYRESYQAMDDPATLARHSRDTANGLRVAELRLEGVHCAACLWLVERLPSVLPGVADARLNLRSAMVRVTWDPERVELSRIAESLDHLGYPAYLAGDVSAQEVRRREQRRHLARLGVAGALAGNTMLIALALYAGLFTGIEPHFVQLFRWISAGLGIVALAWPGAVFFRGAWAAIVARRPNLDLPIALALTAGGAAGVVNTILARGEIYFDSLSVLVFLLLVGRWFQARQQRWADEAVGLMHAFTPSTCRVVAGEEIIERPVESLQVGEIVQVRSGDLAPADGVVIAGRSNVNQALLTGESAAVDVTVGDSIFAGTQNLGSALRVRTQATGEATRVGALMRLVDQGVRDKPPVVQFTDRAAGWFVAAVVALASVTFLYWAGASGVGLAVDHTVALLIVACPCALGLATPLTMAMAIGVAARRNILVKNAGALEGLAAGGRMLLDKTGTLSMGRPTVSVWEGPEWLKPVIAAAERESQHPIGAALREDLASPEAIDANVTQVTERGDGGLQALLDGKPLAIGSPGFLKRLEITIPDSWADKVRAHHVEGRTVVLVAYQNSVVAFVALEDSLREGASAAVQQLTSLGWRPGILSGDAQGVVCRMARAVGIGSEDAIAEVTPEEKLLMVKSRDGQRTAMVGDGVNDAAALAAADVGVAVHGGAEASLAAADVYLAQPGLGSLVDLVKLSRRTMRVVRRNLAISIGYNALAVGLAAAGLITPLVAAVLMPISSATVLGAAVAGFRKG